MLPKKAREILGKGHELWKNRISNIGDKGDKGDGSICPAS